jgi:hypothetical protein
VKENNENQTNQDLTVSLPAHVVAWNNSAELYFLPVDALGKTFRFAGKDYTIRGISHTKRSLPVLTTDSNGFYRTFSAKTVRRFFK